MKFLVLSALLLGSGCAAKVATAPASAPTEKPKAKKFYINHVVDEKGNEKDCVFLEARESEKVFHALFICGQTLVHVGLEK